MIGLVSASLRRLRRAVSRSEWWVRLSGLPVSAAPAGSPGVVLLHIAGVSFECFEAARRRGRLPFLNDLVERQEHRVLRQRGQRAAAFQQELFYGVTPPGPAGAEPPMRVERELERGPSQPLLRGGSSYADGLAGGAAEPHYCPGADDRAPPFGAGHPALARLFPLLHAGARLRASPGARLRELTVVGVQIDVARGLPIVHASFHDFDAAVRRAGAGSKAAVRALAAVDAAVARIWRAAQRSELRHYDIWVYATRGTSGPDAEYWTLLPGDIAVPLEGRTYLRALDLRRAALDFLGRVEGAPAPARRSSAAPRPLRVMTYNVHRCLGMDGRLSPERIARAIARHEPDVVALQELDVTRARTGGIDQARAVAGHLRMDFHFHPVIHLEEERYGDAILTHLPMRLVKAGPLPGLPRREPRGALWVAIEAGGVELQVINTHLGLSPEDRRLQAEALLGPDWLASPQCRAPVVLCGDFNAFPGSPVCRRIRGRLKDAQTAFAQRRRRRPRGTFFGRFPLARIDYIFVSEELEVADVVVPTTHLARVASDHLPLVVDLRLGAAAAAGRPEAGYATAGATLI